MQYNQMLQEQNNVCAICSKEESLRSGKKNIKPRFLAVDHDHKTGKVRGLLCANCNLVLGRINDNIDLIHKIYQYLLKYKV